jgi:methylenetetrahydrofolate dehydrogenase (NADP+) / methenyltetrahydrofolate cyclohydrolase
MKKVLDGKELAEFIKERQAKAVRGLRQQYKIQPKLAILRTNSAQVVDSYMRLKQSYGKDILVDVDVYTIDQPEALDLINKLNQDDSVHGIIVQIPLPDPSQTSEILNAVVSNKDVDGLSDNSQFEAPTAVAINWLLSGYDINMRGKNILVVGQGRLVGKPLTKLWRNSGFDINVADKKTADLKSLTKKADILVTATGSPHLITADMVKPDSIIVDAGVSTDSNGLIGDVSHEVRELPGITMTPEKGGVGPLTVSALFENVITASRLTSTDS